MHVTGVSIEYRDVAFRWRPRRPLISGLTHTFERFPTVILGPNGAGKSTLLGLTAGVLAPRAGTVAIQRSGVPASSGRRGLRRVTSLVAQSSTGIPGLSVREAIAYAGWLKGLSRTGAWWASEPAAGRVNLQDQHRAPSAHLSGGETKRLAIAQALVAEPQVLLLDEPTAGLDPVERRNIVTLISELAHDIQVIGSTHEVEDLEASYEVVCVLNRGKVVYQGPTAEFLNLGEPQASPRLRAEAAYARVLGGA